ncbi:MFS transporter [Actinosynnema sp. NPDC004786]
MSHTADQTAAGHGPSGATAPDLTTAGTTTTTDPTGSVAPGRQPHAGLVLLLLCLAEFMIALDFSITNVALPVIQSELEFSATGLQWIISAYAITFGGFLMLGGRVSDLYGRRRLFIAGLAAFAVVSLVAGFAQDDVQLVLLRAAQGLAAAVVAPAALSLLTTSFAEGPERNRALGVYGAVLSFGFASGVILGGVLTDLLNWRWVFFVNVPIGLGAALLAPKLIKESRGEATSRKLDVPGAVTITGSVVSMVYALSTITHGGVGWLVALVLSIVLFVAFLVVEQRTEHPLVPLKAIAQRVLLTANLINVLIIGSFVGIAYVLTLYLQGIEGFTPLQTGLTFAVLGATAVVAGMVTAKLSARIGMTATLVGGLLLQALGTALVAVLPATGAIWLIIAGTAIIGFGHVAAVVVISISATAGVPDHQQGLAGGLLNTSQQLGAALGAAAFAAIAAGVTGGLLGEGVALEDADPASLVSGFRYALVVATIVAVVGGAVGLSLSRRRAAAG